MMTLTSPENGWILQRIEGDSGALESLHRHLETIVDNGENARAVLVNVESGLEGRGRAIARAKEDAGEIARRIDPALSTVRRIATIVRNYGEVVGDNVQKANALVDGIMFAHLRQERAEQDHADAQLAETRARDGGDQRVIGDADQDVEDARVALAQRGDELSELWREWESSYRLWDDAYGNALARLAVATSGAAPAGLRDVVSELANADSPAAVAAIWASLPDADKNRLRDGMSAFIGNLEGVPYGDRMLANRIEFDRIYKGMPYGDPLDGQLKQLRKELGRPGGQLLMFHPFESPQATAAVVYGAELVVSSNGRPADPMADVTNANVLVGGMFSGLGDLKSFGESARSLNRDSQDYGAGKSVTIAWYGYDSPNVVTEHFMGSAEEGAATLTSSLRGLDVAVSSGVTTTVIGHSYGSTTAFLAVGSATENLGVDRLVAVGSAGVPDDLYSMNRDYAPVSGDLFLGTEPDYSGTQVYATRAPWDVIARYGQYSSGGHTDDPGTLPNAISFESDGGYVPGLDGEGKEWAVGTPGHASHDGGNTFLGWWEKDNGYLSEGSESFRHIAMIVATGNPVN